MGRKYSAQFQAVAVTVQQDLFELLGPTNGVMIVHSIQIDQSTEVGDAQEEGLQILLKRGVGSVTSGSGGSSPTVQQIEDGDASMGGSAAVEANNTTKMATGSGSIEQLASWNWNVRTPFMQIFTPELRPIISPGNRLTVELATTPADSITMSGTVFFEIMGG